MVSDTDFVAEYVEEAAAPASAPATPPEPKPEPKEPEQLEPDIVVVDAVAEAAKAQGWVPLDAWDGNPADWRDAEVFLERGRYFKQMSEDRKKISNLNAQLDHVVKMTEAIRKSEREKVLKELNEQKKTALDNSDFAAVADIDKSITEVEVEGVKEEKTAQLLAAAEQVKEQKRLFLQFVKANPWYVKNPALKSVADSEADLYRLDNPQASYDDMMTHVLGQLKAQYPSEFSDGGASDEDAGDEPAPQRRSPVTSSNSTTQPASKRGKSKKTYADLNAMQKAICDRYVRNEQMTREEYVEELVKIGEV